MAATQPTVKTLIPVIEKSVINLNAEKKSEVDVTGLVTSTDSTDNATKLSQDTKEPAHENSEAISRRVCEDVDQCSLPQPAQLSKALAINCRKPFSVKRRLSYERLHEIPTSKLYSDNMIQYKETNDDSSHQTQQDEQVESDTIASKHKESCSGTESIKASNQMQSSPNFSPSGKVLTSFNSLKAISPLTKAFKSSFHVQGSQPSLELQQPSHSMSTATTSPPVMIPSFSVPCLLSPHPVPQTFILDTPPLRSRISKSPSLLSLAGTNVGSSLERNGDMPRYPSTRILMSQPSSGMGATISYSNVVYATPTTSYTNYSHSMISDVTSPSPAGYSKSGCGRSLGNVTLESMLRGHRHSADGMRSPNVNVRSQPSNSRGEQQKQAVLQVSPLQPMQPQAQPSLRCPRLIHCSNCGHRIDLKTYIHSQQRTGNSEVLPPAHRSILTKSSVTTAGLTVFDLEVICDTGHIDQTLSTPTTGEQQAKGSNNTMFCRFVNDKSSSFGKLPHHSTGTTKPCFPHSDELTRSFAPILSNCVGGCTEESTLADGWGKLDTLDVNEMLQLLETTSVIQCCSSRNPCTKVANGKVYDKPQKNNEITLESVQHANHIVNEDYDPCYELHSSSGKTSLSGKSRKTVCKLTRYQNLTTDRRNDNEKSESSNSDGEVVQCEAEPDGGKVLCSRAKQPTSRICKRRPRKKQIKKTSHNKKKDKQKITA